jgi:hypothetical protein
MKSVTWDLALEFAILKPANQTQGRDPVLLISLWAVFFINILYCNLTELIPAEHTWEM